MGINQFQSPASPIDAISKALNVAATVYGIKHASAANDLINQQIAATQQKTAQDKTTFDLAQKANEAASTPDSPLSQLAQQDQAAYVGAAVKKGYIDPDTGSKLIGLIQGKPGGEMEDGDGETVAVPGLSANALKATLPEGGALAGFVKGAQAADAKKSGFDFRDNQLQERQDYQAHQKTLAKLKGDPQLTKRLAQYQNLGNALSNFQNADISNPQAIDELQQGIRQNLGIGGGGVGEREHTYINSLGLNADRIKQFVTGDPVAISKDAPLAQHLKQLVALESQNIGSQMDKRITALTAGNKSVYDRNPEYKSDLMDAVGAAKDQYAAPAGSVPESAVTVPDSSSKTPPPEPQGMSELQANALKEIEKRKASRTVKR